MFLRKITALMLALAVSACGGVETASRNATDIPTMSTRGAVATPQIQAPSQVPGGALLANARIVDFTVEVPQSLRVSEANAYLPKGDIVWRGDPMGDRHAQVRALFQDGLRLAGSQLNGEVPIRVDIKVRRFHGLTEKARYTTGGVHNIIFDLDLRHAVTGERLRPVKTVRADLKAFGGRRAIEAEAAGHTQKFRITQHLARVMNEELTTVAGHTNARLGIIQAMNYAM